MIDKLYTYFGAKKKIVDQVWRIFGNDKSYTKYFEPFCGSAVIGLNAPDSVKELYLNDFDCHIANVLRSVIYYPDIVIEHACHPRLELDLHMIHDYLQTSTPILRELLMSGIQNCDPIKSGWWIWGCNNWLGGGWCTEYGQLKTLDDLALRNRDLWRFEPVVRTGRNKLIHRDQATENKITGTLRKKLIHRDQATENKITGTLRKKLNNCDRVTENIIGTKRNKLNHGNQETEKIIGTKRLKLVHRDQVTENKTENDYARKAHISNLIYNAYTRLRDAKILYGDFERLLTNSYITGKCLIFLDPPYPSSDEQTYTSIDTHDVFRRAYHYFIDNYQDDNKRIIFCCQQEDINDYTVPEDVRVIKWSRGNCYPGVQVASGNKRHTEILLLSKACLTNSTHGESVQW